MSTSKEIRTEALRRALAGQSLGNYPLIIEGFKEKGIPEEDIRPRENVFTYNAWLELGRQVRRGEKGIKVATFVNRVKEDKETGKSESYSIPKTTAVFHISQTDEVKKGGAK